MEFEDMKVWISERLEANCDQNSAGRLLVKNYYRGAIRMARKLGAISKDEYTELKNFIIHFYDETETA
jgi:hypothetical protein